MPQTGPRFGDVLRSLAFYSVFYGGSVGFVVATTLTLFLAPARFHVIADNWSTFHRFCVRRLLGISIELRGEMPPGQVLVAYKHEAFFEAIDVPRIIRHPSVFAKAELLKIPMWGRAAAAYGILGVERDQGAKALRAMVAEAKRLSAEGRTLVIFPEGTRVPHGQHPRLQAGFAGLYKLLGMPVVPIAVNSGPLYHRLWKRRGTITIAIGETIPPGLPRGEIEPRVHAAINLLNSPEPM